MSEYLTREKWQQIELSGSAPTDIDMNSQSNRLEDHAESSYYKDSSNHEDDADNTDARQKKWRSPRVRKSARTDIRMFLRPNRFDEPEDEEEILDADVERQNYSSAHITESLHKTLVPPEVYRALTSGDSGFLEQYLKNSRDLESCALQVSSDGDTVLHMAARLGQDRIVCLIFKQFHGLKLSEHQNYVGNLPLHEAVSAGHLSTVQILLSPPALGSTSSAPADNSTSSYASKILRHKNKEKDSALHLALRNRHIEVASFLFKTDSAVTHDLNTQQQSPLHMAAEAGYEDLFKLMMNNCFSTDKYNPEDILKEWNQRSRLVYVAISGKNRGILGAVLDKWPGFIETEGWKLRVRPLSHAAFIGYLDGVNDILDKSTATAYLEERSGMYPIHMACSRGHVHILEVFLDRCPASRELRNRKDGLNILHVAASCGRAKAVSHILKIPQTEMLINERDCHGNTPLHLAAVNAHPKVVSTMTWDSRVDLNLVNQKGMTALDVAENYNGNVASFRQRLTWQALRYAGANRARRESMMGMMNQYLNSNLNPRGRENMDFYKDRVNTLMLVSILVVTIAFAAGFISPENFYTSESKEGSPTTLFQDSIFVLFVISNTIALYTSITVVVALIWAQLGDLRLVLASLRYTVPVLGVSLAMISVAFTTGVYLVVRKNTWLAILVFVIGSIGFLILFVLFAPLYSPSSLKHRFARHIFYYQLCLLIKVTHSDVDDNSKEK